MNNKEFVILGEGMRIEECIRKLRTETAFSVKRTQADLLNLRKTDSDKLRFEEQIKKIMVNLGRLLNNNSQVSSVHYEVFAQNRQEVFASSATRQPADDCQRSLL
jgi:hypothetical protein